jgi:hypothetical protein
MQHNNLSELTAQIHSGYVIPKMAAPTFASLALMADALFAT